MELPAGNFNMNLCLEKVCSTPTIQYQKILPIIIHVSLSWYASCDLAGCTSLYGPINLKDSFYCLLASAYKIAESYQFHVFNSHFYKYKKIGNMVSFKVCIPRRRQNTSSCWSSSTERWNNVQQRKISWVWVNLSHIDLNTKNLQGCKGT